MMKLLNKILGCLFILVGASAFSQTIVLNACHALIENQDYTFNQKTLDVTGRYTYETNPVDANSPCGGIGNCEFQIAWNDTNSRWEILADDGDGTFTNTYVLYYNAEASLPNPPSLNLGTWVEETTVTQSECGTIFSLTGNVQDVTMSVKGLEHYNQIGLFPNPAHNILSLKDPNSFISRLELYNVNGKKLMSFESNIKQIDISKYAPGLYIVKLEGKDKTAVFKKFIKQ